MKQLPIFVSILLTLTLTATNASALRCGQQLAEVGDLKHELFLACGEPYSKEMIGYIDRERSGDRIRVMKIEEWIVESNNNYYSIIFEGNRLVRIESAGRKK